MVDWKYSSVRYVLNAYSNSSHYINPLSLITLHNTLVVLNTRLIKDVEKVKGNYIHQQKCQTRRLYYVVFLTSDSNER